MLKQVSSHLKHAARCALQSLGLLPMPREQKMLHGCGLDGMGLEIGPSYCPIAPKREGYQVEVLDHADAATLKEKYKGHGVDLSKIEEVDYVWSGQPLHELTGKRDHYDWIVASHVIEHTPDLVSFFRQCEIMLKPDGVLCLAVPDHRYCFDVFRPASTPGEIIQAYLEKRCRHSLAAVWDHCSMIVQKGGVSTWKKNHRGAYQLIHPDLRHAQMLLEHAQKTEEYIDVHNWRFTPASFRLIVHDIRVLGYTNLRMKTFFPTQGCEFVVQLQKSSDEKAPDGPREILLQETLREARARK